MHKALQILVLSDGKPGHRNQSLGLAEAIQRLTFSQIQVIEITSRNPFSSTIQTLKQAKSLPHLDLIIGAGHSTHIPLLTLGKILDAPTVVLMKPSLPCALFDLCLVPQHDLDAKDYPPYIIPTVGALNRIQAGTSSNNRGLIMIGGPSKEFAWNGELLQRAISEIVTSSPLEWHLTDSRRTPHGFLDTISSLPLTIHPHQTTTPNWLPAQLADVRETWVTQDSVSMIFEALSSSAAVGILPLPPNKKMSKISRAVQQLCETQQASFFSDWQKCHLLPASTPLREADRCARFLVQALYPHRL
jgi:mitochondrial fission protein ELM1